MTQADLLVQLLISATNGDQVAFRKNAETIIAEERAKGHRILADRMVKAIQPKINKPVVTSTPLNGASKNLFYEITPERSLDSLVLKPEAYKQIKELVEEQHRFELLHSYNLRARNSVLLTGASGNGKTTLAEALAYELMYPLIIIRYETLIGSYLGETAGRLKSVIDYAKTQRCVLFLDEFETLGKERGDTNETGEIKRVVSQLLLQLDSLPDYVVVVAASNHPELLDRAVWRRFQVRMELRTPTLEQAIVFIDKIASRCRFDFGTSSETIAKKLLGNNFAEIEQFCLGIVRRAVLDGHPDSAKG